MRLFLEGVGYACAEAGDGLTAVELEKEDDPRCPYCLTSLNPFEVWWAVVEGHTGCGVGFCIAFFGCAGLGCLVGKVPALDLGWPIYLIPVTAGIVFTCVYFSIVLTRQRPKAGSNPSR